MKYTYLVMTLIIFCLCSCKKEEEGCYLDLCVDWEVYTSQSTLNNTTPWKAQHVWFGDLNSGKKIIHLNFANEFGYLREKIRIREFDLALGTIPLTAGWGVSPPYSDEPSAHFNTFTADGDALTEFYDLYDKEGFENYITINRISADTSEIEGEYQLFFVLSLDSPSKLDEYRPDTLVFTNGIFTARSID